MVRITKKIIMDKVKDISFLEILISENVSSNLSLIQNAFDLVEFIASTK